MILMRHETLLQTLSTHYPLLKRLVPRRIKRLLLVRIFGVGRGYQAPPSRLWLEKEILPNLPTFGFTKILFVGTAPYTWHYERIVRRSGGEWVTAEANPSANVWGARRHIQGR